MTLAAVAVVLNSRSAVAEAGQGKATIVCGVELTGSDALIKSTLAANPLPIPFAETGLKGFQETAFTAAYVGHMAK